MHATVFSLPGSSGREWSGGFQILMGMVLPLVLLEFLNDRNLPVSLFDIAEQSVNPNQSDVGRNFVRERCHILEQRARAPEITRFFRGERQGEFRRYVIRFQCESF